MRYNTIITIVLLGFELLLGAQDRQEGLLLLTDRGHYISGETINYRAFYMEPGESGQSSWSKILYVELILPNGTPLAQGKVSIDTAGAIGSIAIPEGLSSGTYYLKSYTRWMRNCGPEDFVYTSIRIYDPYNDEVLPVDSTGWEPIAVGEMLFQEEAQSPDMLECKLEQNQYGSRQELVAELTWNFPYEPINLTVSVARAGLHSGQAYLRPGCPAEIPARNEVLPETKGISLTGQAVSASDGSPAPYATIYITVLSAEKDFFCNYSDSAGRFYFTFPSYAGERELFVSTYHSSIDELELLIDRDFSQDVLQLPSHGMQLEDSLAAVITEMSVNAQISRQYYPREVTIPEEEKGDEMFFYGFPNSTIYFDDFIRLPNLEEYFVEVVPQVAVRKTRGVRKLVLLGEHPDLVIYPPLLMIDGVAIFDVDAVLAVSPRLIQRVEIVNVPYIRGNVTFGGIISLISNDNDLGYIDLPSSGLLVNYRMLDIPWADSSEEGVSDSSLPDVRNTLYWNPNLHIEPGQSQKISFRTSDLKGEYDLLIRGYDLSGKYYEKQQRFTVE